MNKMNSTLCASVLLLSLVAIGCAPKGDAGPAGAPGAGRVTASLNCQGVVQNLSGAAAPLNGLTVEYNAVLTSGGDVYATSNIIDGSSQASGTVFYAAAQAGSATATVDVTADYVGAANGGFWEVSVDRSTLITSVVYDDPSLSAPVNLTFAASACTLGNF